METPIYNVLESNNIIKGLIEGGEEKKPFFIARLSDIETKVSLYMSLGRTLDTKYYETLQNNAGIYYRGLKDIELYVNIYNKAVMNATHMTCFRGLYCEEQNYYMKRKNIDRALHSRVLEPFYIIEEGKSEEYNINEEGEWVVVKGRENTLPWTHSLKDKKVLVISPFVESFKRQMEIGWTFYNTTDISKQIFLPEQKFIFYKAYNTLAGNHLHSNWFETFALMCKDIKNLDFDVALLSCGGYGLPLCNYIYSTLGKSAIYIGGGLQLLFGVNGDCWKDHEIISRVSSLPENKWTRPSNEESIQGQMRVEGGCYW